MVAIASLHCHANTGTAMTLPGPVCDIQTKTVSLGNGASMESYVIEVKFIAFL